MPGKNMMVPIIENYSAIEGLITAINDHPPLPGYMQLNLSLENSNSVTGFPNLAAADEGRNIVINIKKDDAAVKKIGVHKSFKGIVKKASHNEYFYMPG